MHIYNLKIRFKYISYKIKLQWQCENLNAIQCRIVNILNNIYK